MIVLYKRRDDARMTQIEDALSVVWKPQGKWKAPVGNKMLETRAELKA